MFNVVTTLSLGERGGLVVNASDSGSRSRGFERVKPCCVLEQGTFTPQKALVIPRKRWLRPNMTEKLFTRTLRINQPTNSSAFIFDRICFVFAGKEDNHKSFDKFEFRLEPTSD